MNAVMDHGGWVLVELWLCHVRHRPPEGGGLSRSIKVTSAWLEVIVQASHSPVPPPGSGHCCWDSKPSSDCTCTHHHDGTELPLQADWAGGASSSTGTMTPAEHGKKRHILAFAISSDWGDVLSVHRVDCASIFLFVLSQLFLNQLPNTFCTKSKKACARIVDVLRSQVPFYGNSSAESSSNFQEQKRWRLTKFWIKPLFVTHILRLYMLILLGLEWESRNQIFTVFASTV